MDLALIIVPAAVVLLLLFLFLRVLRQSLRPADVLDEDRIVEQSPDRAVVADNRRLIEEHFNSEQASDVERVLSFFTDDVVWEAPYRNLRFKGKDQVATNYQNMFKTMEDLTFQKLAQFATVDKVVDYKIASFTAAVPEVWNVPKGSKVNMLLLHIFEMRGGKISKEIALEILPPHSVEDDGKSIADHWMTAMSVVREAV